MAHNINPGVATGDEVQLIFNYAKEKGFGCFVRRLSSGGDSSVTNRCRAGRGRFFPERNDRQTERHRPARRRLGEKTPSRHVARRYGGPLVD